jgi:hypothetical protein
VGRADGGQRERGDKPLAGTLSFTSPCFKTADDAGTSRSWRYARLPPLQLEQDRPRSDPLNVRDAHCIF